MDLREALASLKPVSDTAFEKLSRMTHTRAVKRGECVISQGEPSDLFLIIKQGIFRLWFAANGKVRTMGFGSAGDPFTSFSTMLSPDRPAPLSFQAITDAEVYYVHHRELRQLMEEDREISDWVVTYLLAQLDVLYNKKVIFGTQNATERLEAFVRNRPDVYGAVPAKYLAQYINIAPETLSRIQASLFRKKD